MCRFARRCWTLGMICLLAAAPAAHTAVNAEIDRVLQEFNRSNSPGCSVAVFREGRLAFAKGYGMASLELGVPITPQTVFYVGSTSKQFVAASIVLAARQGLLSLDDDFRKYVPEIPDYGETITIRQLIHHTSGLRDYLDLMYLGRHPWENVYTDDWIVDLIGRQKALNFPPGERYLYSNSGYFLLARIVERATGKKLREYADENIFQPLGMVHTHFHDDRGHVFRNRAMAYTRDEDGRFRLEWYTNFDKVGSGGLMTTVEDLLLWDRVFYESPFGGDGFVDQMLERGRLDNGEVLDYAFALEHGEHRGLPTVHHAGSFMGFRAQLLRFPEQHLSVATLCNLESADPTSISQQVAALFLAGELDPAEAAANSSPPDIEALPLVEAEAARIVGHYWSEENHLAHQVRVEEGKLVYVRSEESKSELAPVGDGRYRMLDVPFPMHLQFEPRDAARADRVIVHVDDREPASFERFESWQPSASELERFAGTFYSDELDADYVLAVIGEHLVVGAATDYEAQLEPVYPGLFTTAEGGALRFVSIEESTEGFTLDSDRARGLRFVKH